MNEDLFMRKAFVEFGVEGSDGIQFRDIRLSFRVDKSRKSDPDKATISIYNLAESSINLLLRKNAVIRLYAGYSETPPIIFEGTAIKNGIKVDRSGVDKIATIEALDGGRAWTEGRVRISQRGEVTFESVYKASIQALGLPEGVVVLPAGLTFPSGLVVDTPAREMLNRLAKMSESEWFVRHNVVNFVPRGDAIRDYIPKISSKDGNLVGSPNPTAKGVEINCLLDGSIQPASEVFLESKYIQGNFVSQDVSHAGDSTQGEFLTRILGVPS